MTGTDNPALTDKGRADAQDRQRRQAEALRANLARRKAQGRARAHGGRRRECRAAGQPDEGMSHVRDA